MNTASDRRTAPSPLASPLIGFGIGKVVVVIGLLETITLPSLKRGRYACPLGSYAIVSFTFHFTAYSPSAHPPGTWRNNENRTCLCAPPLALLEPLKSNEIVFLLVSTLVGCNKSLPTPEVMDGLMGAQFGVDKNINVETIDKYLNRKDTVYRDTRMLIDPANYEAIGGDSYLSGFINGFEVVPYPFLAPTIGLPSEVGNGYTGDTLFSIENNEYIPNYNESISIINSSFV